MNTLIEGGHDSKLTAKLQKLQGMAVKESASERALKMDFFGKVREFGNRLGLTHAMQVGHLRWSRGVCVGAGPATRVMVSGRFGGPLIIVPMFTPKLI